MCRAAGQRNASQEDLLVGIWHDLGNQIFEQGNGGNIRYKTTKSVNVNETTLTKNV